MRAKRISIKADDLESITSFGIFCGENFHPDKLVNKNKISPRSMYGLLLTWNKRAKRLLR